MRLFVAIAPPEPVLAGLDAELAPLRPGWPGLRWTGPQAWHVTLAFLGEVNEAVVPELRTRLGRAARRHDAPVLSVAGAGAFPSPRSARVLWAGIAAGPSGGAALAALARSVAAGARRAGAPPPDEGRRYRPHLTLARCRLPADVRPLVDALAPFAGAGWTAAEIHLISSRPAAAPAAPPRYVTEGTWPLRWRS